MHNIFVFTIIFVMNFSNFLAEPQNYDTQRNRQGYARSNPVNVDTRDYIYQHFDPLNGHTQVVNFGNGYNRENNVIIDSRPNGRARPEYNNNRGSAPTGPGPVPGQSGSKIQSTDFLTSRFGNDNPDTVQYTRFNNPDSGFTSINNIGNGINNHNTVIIRQHDKSPGGTITVVSPNVPGGRQTIDTRYKPANIPGNNYQSNTRRYPQSTYSTNNIGRGNNHNFISVNGQVVSTDSDGASFTTVNSNRPPTQGEIQNSEDGFKVLPLQKRS